MYLGYISNITKVGLDSGWSLTSSINSCVLHVRFFDQYLLFWCTDSATAWDTASQLHLDVHSSPFWVSNIAFSFTFLCFEIRVPLKSMTFTPPCLNSCSGTFSFPALLRASTICLEWIGTSQDEQGDLMCWSAWLQLPL